MAQPLTNLPLTFAPSGTGTATGVVLFDSFLYLLLLQFCQRRDLVFAAMNINVKCAKTVKPN